MTKVLLAHTPQMFEGYYGEPALAALSAVAVVKRHEGSQSLRVEELIELAKDCQIIVSDRATPGEAAIFPALPELVAFVRCAVDIRTVDVDAASANGVLVTRATPGFVDAVNEWILGVMVDLARGISKAVASYRRGEEPTALMGTQLRGATIGVVGLGAIGTKLAPMASLLGMNVLVHDPFVESIPDNTQAVEFSELLARSDFVVCLVVANERTENMFGAPEFELMKRSAFFINASRGNLVNEDALHNALTRGALAGAAMDVGRAPDQKPSLELAGLDNVIATPHIGGLTRQAVEHQAFDTVRQVTSLVAGDIPQGAVNLQLATRMSRFKKK
ncbi:MAG: D-3-phosphoglycerate dehydrogenase [Hyphomicrobiaceae bacterium]|jgi:D-3-phosphoglycerate dehydrogenase